MIHTLYKTTNTKTGQFYIGVHKTDDVGFGTDTWIDPYVGSGRWVKRTLKKYGRDSFDVEVIAYFDNEDFAYTAEGDLVTEEWLERMGDRTYNITPGGKKPPKMTSELAIRANAGRKARGTDVTGGLKAYQTSLKRGTYSPPPIGSHNVPHSEETKEILRQKSTGHPPNSGTLTSERLRQMWNSGVYSNRKRKIS